MVAAPIGLSVTGQVYRDKWQLQRQGKCVPGVGVLRAPMEEYELCGRIPPEDCAHTSIAHIDMSTRHVRLGGAHQPGVLGALD